MLYLLIILLFFVGYFLGSIPFGLLLTKWAGLGDVRNIGSGNIGATNVLRTGNKKIAALTLLFDGLKGTIAVIFAQIIAAYVISRFEPSNNSTIFSSYFALSAAIGALLGHLFPIWLNFKGGKGVATYLGILLALSWQGALVFGIVWLLTAFFTRYSSLAAIFALICVPISLWLFNINNITVFVISLMSILILYKHRSTFHVY